MAVIPKGINSICASGENENRRKRAAILAYSVLLASFHTLFLLSFFDVFVTLLSSAIRLMNFFGAAAHPMNTEAKKREDNGPVYLTDG